MVNKKQARANERKRQEQLERKVALKEQERRQSRQQWRATAAIAAGVLLVIALIGAVAVLADKDDPEPGSTASATPGATSDPAPTADGLPAPDPTIAAGRDWTMTLDTSQGPITITLDGAAAPQATAALVSLGRTGYFDQTDCHRLTTAGIYVLQCGDPNGDGTGGPGYSYGPIENAPADGVYPAGTVAMARHRDDAGSMGSQFFIVYEDSTIPTDSAGGYTVVGTVTDGLGIVGDVASAGTITGDADGRPATSVIINEVAVE